MVGYGIGTLLGMPLLQLAVESVGWRNAIVIQAGESATPKVAINTQQEFHDKIIQ